LGRYFKRLLKNIPKKIPMISYIPRKDELELLI